MTSLITCGHDTEKHHAKGMCRKCYWVHAARLHRERHPEHSRRYKRNMNLVANYGITADEYDAMLAAQGGGCANRQCGAKPGTRALHVDHCHDTGRIRGLLCHHCNATLGNARDSCERLAGLIDYLIGY